MSLKQARQDLTHRRLQEANKLYLQASKSSETRARALLGMAHVAFLRQNLDVAKELIDQSQRMTPSPLALVYEAMLTGERGQRAAAYERLEAMRGAVDQQDRGFTLALLGEQRVRQGYWSEGTALFIQAIDQDDSLFALAHVREVLCDMSEAVVAGRLPAEEPLRMLNRLDSGTPSAYSPFFAGARRAMNQGEPIPRSLPLPGETSQSSSSTAPGFSSSQRDVPARRFDTRIERDRVPPSMESSPAPRLQAHASSDLTSIRRDGSVKSEFRQSMIEERRLNEALQATMKPLPKSEWPSMQSDAIDVIERIVSSQPPVSERLAVSQHDTFRVTQGNIFVQLYMERCFAAMTRQLPTEVTGSLVLDPRLTTFLQVNLLDGSMTTDFEVITSDLTEIELADEATSALAYFIGEAFVRAYQGSWSYARSSAQTKVHIGEQEVRPYALAERWLMDERPDPGALYAFIQEADLRASKHLQMNTRQEHLDLTEGLTQQALKLKLAELWSLYCVRHARTSFVEIARQIEVLEVGDAHILLEIDQAISPRPPSQRRKSAHTKKQRLCYAYRRESGEFLMLSQASALAYMLSERFGPITSDNAPAILACVRDYHAPGGILVDSAATAQQARFSSLGVAAPTLARKGNAMALSCWIVESNQRARQLELTCVVEDELDGVVWRSSTSS